MMKKSSPLKPWSEHEAGLVLLTTILMIATISVLVLSTLQGLYLYTQTSSQLILDHQQFYRLEAAAHHLMKAQQMHLSRCRIQDTNSDTLIKQLLEHKGCLLTFGGESYQFLMSDLGKYPCLQLKSNHQLLGSQHTLLTIVNEQEDALQLRIARPVSTDRCQQQQPIRIHSGIISWRLISRAHSH